MWVENIEFKSENGSLTPYFKPIDLDKAPDLMLVFGDTDTIIDAPVASEFKAQFPNCHIIGCSTGTHIGTNSVSDDGVSGILVGFEKTNLELSRVKISDYHNSFEIGSALGQNLRKANLVTVFVLSDGLNVNGSDIVGGLLSVLGGRISVSGGLAGDGGRFGKTRLISEGEAVDGYVSAIGFYSDSLVCSHASVGGFDEFGPEWVITKSEGNVMYEIGDMKALDLYDQYLQDDAQGLPATGLLYPLRIWHPNYPNHDIVRTLLAIDREQGTLTFAGDVPQGWHARLMKGTEEGLIGGAAQAAQDALAMLKSKSEAAKPDLCLVVSCVGRRLILGDNTKDEINAISKILGDESSIAGFYSYGEIAPHNFSRLCCLHNQTVTLTLMSEI